MFWFHLPLLSPKFLTPKRIQRDIMINVQRPSCKIPIITVRFKSKFEFSRKVLGKFSNIKFLENPSRTSRVFQYGRTDRHKTNSHCSQFFDARSNSVPVQSVLWPNTRNFVVHRVLQGVPKEHSQHHVGEVSFWASTWLICKWWREYDVHFGGHFTIQQH